MENGAAHMEFCFIVTSLRGDPFTVKVTARTEAEADALFWAKMIDLDIDQAEWETNSYEYHLTK